ncbi:hypothetical protein MMC10_009765 [Thelotrema lepadinum]|nr:hypothetical protein [Thelotrema lepadinum]
MDAFTPQQTTELVGRIGTKKADTRYDKLFFNSFMAGPLLGFGCAIALSTEAAPWFQTNAPGLIRTIGATFFPIGLVMIMLSGADLFTSNIMFMTVAFLERRVTLYQVAKIWIVSFFGNLAGSAFFVAFILGWGGVFQTSQYREEVINFATMKAVDPGWHQIFLRAIGANWLVCFAVFLSISAREIVSKIVAIWFPTLTFVALALDHVIANMVFIPTAIWLSHPSISTGYYIWKSMIPTLLGNMIGGGVFVGAVYWYLYLTGEGAVDIDFNTGSLDSALQAGGPMGPEKKVNGVPVLDGQKPEHESSRPTSQLPHSGGYMTSGLARELSGEKYGKRVSEKAGDEEVQI